MNGYFHVVTLDSSGVSSVYFIIFEHIRHRNFYSQTDGFGRGAAVCRRDIVRIELSCQYGVGNTYH